ncbi:hypothetical protein P5673_009846 [Acropora cervicornis]|uniref:HTH CENPB-type domain-containing protein n=1 Tax=Acropora cervicornis TaxID=6130 RepID=A0AAD9QSK9_ACRCE|nr:hypothetical protein P5673_009846 [Acropora cervicornis]
MKVLRTDVEEASGSAAQYSSTNKLYLLFGVGDELPEPNKRALQAMPVREARQETNKFEASENWFQRFKHRGHNISLRRRTKKKNAANDGRQFSLKEGRSASWIRCRWLPKNRKEASLDSQPGSDLGKSQATLQLCIRTEGEQTVKPAIIFRGKGCNVSSEEQVKYDKDVDVYFQINAWVEAEVNMQWTRHTLHNGLTDDPTEKVFVTWQMNTIVYLLPDNCTNKVQPADTGFGRIMREEIVEAMQIWLGKKKT